MGRLSKCIIGIALPLLFLLGQISSGATITDFKLEEKEEKGSGVNENWKATNYYIKEITILRMSKNEAFSVELPSGPLLRGWQDHYHDDKIRKRFTNITRSENRGIEVLYGGTVSVDNYSNENYRVINYSAQGNQLMMRLKSRTEKKNNDRPTLNGKRIIKVSSAVPDGEYDLTSTIRIGGTAKSHTGKVKIKTLPSISIEDIDFGNYLLDGKKIKAEKSSPIFIIGGTPREKFKLSIEGVGEVRARKKDKVKIALRNPNTDKVIEVELSIEGLKDSRLDSDGNKTDASVKAKIDEKDPPTVGGAYTGRAKIIFQYD